MKSSDLGKNGIKSVLGLSGLYWDGFQSQHCHKDSLKDLLEKSNAIFIMENYSLSIYISISIVMGS